ncbi:MAG: hypothetical protein C4321_11400, partial [Chloroflexota bacterium]
MVGGDRDEFWVDGEKGSDGFGEGGDFVGGLAEVGFDVGKELEGTIDERVGAAAVGADGDEVACVFVGGEELAKPAGGL